MPLALLLSPDDQAVSAITAVLEEMSVTCERPLDGASAAQKLNSNRFDLVLVDCENLPAAKLIFDVCRNRKDGSHPVPVAVVDGRAGLPTAFRLGAELILTKPVAKDQARVTIRTAISRVKREDSAHTAAASAQESTTQAVATPENLIAGGQQPLGTHAQHADNATELAMPQERAFAATASAGSVSLTSFSDTFPAATETTAAMTMSAAVAEPEIVEADSAPTDNLASSASNASAAVAHLSAVRSSPMSAAAKTAPAKNAATEPAEEKEEEVEATAVAENKDKDNNSDAKAETKAESVLSAAPQGAAKSNSPEQKSEEKSGQKSAKNAGQKSHGRVVILVVLLVACGAFYAAWLYEPGFQALAKSQINHFLVVTGMAPQPQSAAPAPLRPAVPTAKPSAAVPAQTSTPDAAQPSPSAGMDPNAAPSATSAPATSSPLTSSPSTSITPTSPALSIKPVATPGAQSASSAAVQSAPATAGAGQPASAAASPAAKSGVTRIELSPSTVAGPASKTVKHAPPASPATPPQN
jgi:FixJ family two-component response regulator